MHKHLVSLLKGTTAALAIAATMLVAPAVFAQSCPYNSTQASCACPTSGPGVTCFGGQLFRSTDASCQTDTRPGGNNTQLFACSSASFVCNTTNFPCGGCTAATSVPGGACGTPSGGQYTNQCGACGCAAGTQLCSGTNACVPVISCPAGTTFDPCTNSCSSPNILKDQASPQSAFINVTGDIKSSSGDFYLSNGKALRVDGAGATSLSIGNWGGGATGIDVSIVNGTLTVGKTLSVGSSVTVGALSADPTGANGMMFYNSTLNKFRCYQGGSWTDCIASGGGGGTLTGSGAVGQAAFWTGASSLSGDNGFFWDNAAKRLGIGSTTPGYQLDIRNAGASGVTEMRINNDNATRLWSGIALSRQSTERWFVGMNATDDLLRIRSNSSNDYLTMDNSGNITTAPTAKIITTNLQYLNGTPAAGKILTSDASGNATWQAPGAANACTGVRKYVGVTAATYDGNRGGYKNADAICNGFSAGSTVCTAEEVLNSYKCTTGSDPIASATGSAWINQGPPGFTAYSNDCDGWTSNLSGYYGRLWTFIPATGGKATVRECGVSPLQFACCK